jgi:prevent-host-death family protein
MSVIRIRRKNMPRKSPKPLTTSVPALIVRSQFGKILARVARHRERVVVTKKGQAAAVILNIEDFLQNIVHTPAKLSAVQAAAKKSGADTLTQADIDAEIAQVRNAKTPHAA